MLRVNYGFKNDGTWRALAGLFLLAWALGLSGCATVTRGTKDKLKVEPEPSGARVTLSSGASGVTPATFKLSRKKGVSVEIAKEGYETETVLVNS